MSNTARSGRAQDDPTPARQTPVEASAPTSRPSETMPATAAPLLQEAAPVARANGQGGGTQAPSLAEQLSRALVAQADVVSRQGQAEVHLRLEPADLGTIRVHLTASDNTLVARVVVSQQATQHLLQGQASALRQSLAKSGLELGGFDVRHEAGSRSGQQNPQEPPLEPPPGASRRAPPGGKAAPAAESRSRGAVDLLA